MPRRQTFCNDRTHDGQECARTSTHDGKCWTHAAVALLGRKQPRALKIRCRARNQHGNPCQNYAWISNPDARENHLCAYHALRRAFWRTRTEQEPTTVVAFPKPRRAVARKG